MYLSRYLPGWFSCKPALEPVAKQRAERLALAHPVEQPDRGADPLGAEVDGEGVVTRSAVREVAAAQHRGGGGVRQGGGVHVAGAAARRRAGYPLRRGEAAPGSGRVDLRRFSTQP